MKLQAALDTLTLDECLELLEETKGYIDIAEVGTPFIIEAGMVPVRAIKEKFDSIEVLADAKIMDAGEFEADKCFEAGADIVTVLGVSNDETIEIDNMGVDYICVHTAFDVQASGKDPLEELKVVNKVIKNAKSAVAGGVKLSTIDDIVNEGAEIIVVGGAICNAKDRAATSKEMKSHLK